MTTTDQTDTRIMEENETAYVSGYLARIIGYGIGRNPYEPMSDASIAWAEEWKDSDFDTI